MTTIGLDPPKRESQLCIGFDNGRLKEPRISTTRERFTSMLGRRHSPLMSSWPTDPSPYTCCPALVRAAQTLRSRRSTVWSCRSRTPPRCRHWRGAYGRSSGCRRSTSERLDAERVLVDRDDIAVEIDLEVLLRHVGNIRADAEWRRDHRPEAHVCAGFVDDGASRVLAQSLSIRGYGTKQRGLHIA
jgi:hypothetical protein